jgi:DNA-binding transcriptional regulator of glucitol operon
MEMQQIFKILAEIKADRIADREMLKGMMVEMKAKADGKQEEMLARMQEDI